jgi:hypothetical protein
MRRGLFKVAVVSKQHAPDSHTGQEHGNDFQTDHAAIL